MSIVQVRFHRLNTANIVQIENYTLAYQPGMFPSWRQMLTFIDEEDNPSLR